MDLISLFGGVIGGMTSSLLISYFRKDLDFKYNYKLFILNKRQEAYNEIENLMVLLENEGEDDYWNSIPSVFTADGFRSVKNQVW